jgi:hypothetical protein
VDRRRHEADVRPVQPVSRRQPTEVGAHVKVRLRARDRCYDFENIFAEKMAVKLAVLTQNAAF